ncbi:helix-turn-helix domain-containing protein [Halorubrum sp. Atlit-26R]|uniref:winged helix-turn-helix domain-containing protein n=1 Tax=Halorubrum sp. Atlit-26R TaxID=2282128 RepID=UPI000EF1EA56|nr:helix-turn-helix domain-containing protein [Halorubrum sp. Atlit-26R]RLM64181.1 ArsR family transcriptional regulator [Halorubrum sp. Atlit-26R]
MSDKEWDPNNVLDLLGDPLARRVLVATGARPKSAEELAEEFDVSLPTVYRRTNRLIEHGLLSDHLRADERKNQFKVFEATVSEVVVSVEERGYEIEMKTRSTVGTRFDAFWSDIGRSVPDDGGRKDSEDRSVGTDRPDSTEHTDPA